MVSNTYHLLSISVLTLVQTMFSQTWPQVRMISAWITSIKHERWAERVIRYSYGNSGILALAWVLAMGRAESPGKGLLIEWKSVQAILFSEPLLSCILGVECISGMSHCS